jgi:hypothetical protein
MVRFFFVAAKADSFVVENATKQARAEMKVRIRVRRFTQSFRRNPRDLEG